jgi:hypothetical protein
VRRSSKRRTWRGHSIQDLIIGLGGRYVEDMLTSNAAFAQFLLRPSEEIIPERVQRLLARTVEQILTDCSDSSRAPWDVGTTRADPVQDRAAMVEEAVRNLADDGMDPEEARGMFSVRLPYDHSKLIESYRPGNADEFLPIQLALIEFYRNQKTSSLPGLSATNGKGGIGDAQPEWDLKQRQSQLREAGVTFTASQTRFRILSEDEKRGSPKGRRTRTTRGAAVAEAAQAGKTRTVREPPPTGRAVAEQANGP